MTTRRLVLAGLASLPFAHSAANAAPGVLRVGDQKGGAHSLMQAAGVLDGLPYQLAWSQFPAAAPLLEALNAGAVDVAIAGDAPTLFALGAGLSGRIISPIRTTGIGTAIMVPKTSAIQTAADLKGRTVATNRGSIGHALVLGVAETHGWTPTDIRLANLLPNDAKTAMTSGAVDAWSSWGVYVAQARLIDDARVVADGGKGVISGLSYLVAGDEAIARNRTALRDFSRRLVIARRWAIDHPDDYAAALAAEIGVSRAVARLVFDMDAPQPVAIDEVMIRDAQKTADRFLAAGVMRRRIDVARMVDPSFNETLSG